MFNHNPPAAVAQAEATEEQLIQRCRAAISNSAWTIGECAHEWTQRFARGRTDEDFGNLVNLSREQVCQRRLVWETYCDTYHTFPNLSWSHFWVAVGWDDAPECLQWANEIEATVAEMKAWRRAQRGEDLSQPAPEDLPIEERSEPACDDPGFIDSSDDDPVADHECDTNEFVDHKADCATDEPDFDMDEAEGDDEPQEWIEEPDRIEPEQQGSSDNAPPVVNVAELEDTLRQLVSSVVAQNNADDRKRLVKTLRSLLKELEGAA